MRRLPFILAALLLISSKHAAAEPIATVSDLASATIEELLNMRITTLSNVEEQSWSAPAAIYTLTNQDIKNSGVTTLPEALRLVPGVQVAKVLANKWAISARGFNSLSSNKLQVLVDGRSIYDPLYSGVFWETRDVMLEDVDRIEVIRGPAGTTWGANAVNGVINIITMKAKDTQGGLTTLGGGTEEFGIFNTRYGGKVGEDTYARIYGKYNLRDSGYAPGGSDDDTQFGKTGFRIDSEQSKSSTLTFQGDYYNGMQGPFSSAITRSQETTGGNLLLNWNKEFSSKSALQVLTYYDHIETNTQALSDVRHTGRARVQYTNSMISGHRIIAGLDYIYTEDHTRGLPPLYFLDPNDRSDQTKAIFLEDAVNIIPDTLDFIVGTKLEYNDYSDFEHQPNARLAYTIDETNFAWLAVSRAVKLPTRLEEDLNINFPGLAFKGNRNLDAENVISYELGYRTRPYEDFFFDVATFYSRYSDLGYIGNNTFDNIIGGDTYGGEVAFTWQALQDLQLKGSYSLLRTNVGYNVNAAETPGLVEGIEGTNPIHQAVLQSGYLINSNLRFDLILRYVDSLSTYDIGSYLVGDANLSYRVSDTVQLALVGQNLFEAHHYEFGPKNTASEVQQGVYAKVVLTY